MYTLANYEQSNTILLIEDNPGDARLVEILLEDSDINCNVQSETTLQAGLNSLSKSDYAAVLLDLTLPDSRGFQTLEKLITTFPEANVIVLTGLADKEIGLQAVKVGAQDFLVKGDFDSEQLSKSLRYSIERKSVLGQLEEAQRIAHLGNWSYDLQTNTVLASNEIYKILGYERKTELSLASVKKHLTEKSQIIFRDIIEQLEGKTQVQGDLVVKRLDGEQRYISLLCKRSETRGVSVYSGIIQDITERKEAEKALVKSQERYQAIFNQTKDAIYISTKDGKLVDFNTATAELLGYSPEELQQLNINDIFRYKNDQLAFQEEMRANSFTKDFEAPIFTKSGKTVHCLISSSVIQTEEFEGYHSIIRDITEHKQAVELRKAKEVAEQSAKMKEQFLANISHEMRTPMNAILGMSNLVLQSELDMEQESYMTSIKQSSQNLLGIINDILEISSLENGKVNFAIKEFNLYELIHNLVNVIKYKAEQKELQLFLDIKDDVDKYFKGDALRLNQILMNLVGNAVKFTDEGFVKIKVYKIGENENSAKLRFDVTDSGIGIPKDKQEAIFETFVRVSNSKGKLYPGTGLGLAISKQLVQLQGGTIIVESEENVGSTFSVVLDFPKAQQLTQKEEEKRQVKPKRVKLNIDRNVEILLAEDHKLNQIVARKTLEKEFDNINVTIAGNGQIAVDMLQENDFDIILMDIQMPLMNGYEATNYIRDNFSEPKRNIPIFAMTAHAHMAKDEKYKEFGMDECVLKPFEPEDLFTKIAKYVDKINENNHQSDMEPDNGTPKYIDLSYMELMSDGDADMMKMMLELLFDEPLEEIKKMHRLYNKENWSELRAVSHKMKSTLAFVGNDNLTNTNKRIESIAKDVNGTEQLPELITTLETIFGKALVELKSEHAKL